jgi:hypothetical protein
LVAVAIAFAVGFDGGDVVRRRLVIGRHVVVGHPNHVIEFESVEKLTWNFFGMLHPLQYFCWASGGRQGATVIGRDPICNGHGDFPVISPADDEIVIVGDVSIMGKLF